MIICCHCWSWFRSNQVSSDEVILSWVRSVYISEITTDGFALVPLIQWSLMVATKHLKSARTQSFNCFWSSRWVGSHDWAFFRHWRHFKILITILLDWRWSDCLINFLVGFGRFHYKLLLLCGLALLGNTMQILSVSLVLPLATCEFHLTEYQRSLFSNILFFGKQSSALASNQGLCLTSYWLYRQQ